MNRFLIGVLLLVQYNMSFAQSSHDDSLLAHYPMQIGNAWDYSGGCTCLLSIFYPHITLLTAISDTLHVDSQRYTLIKGTIYDMSGQQQRGALGTIRNFTYFTRVDTVTLNVWRVGSEYDTPSGHAVLIDSLRAQVGDSIFSDPGLYNTFYFHEKKDSLLFGGVRGVRSLYLVNSLVGYGFSTCEGIGEIYSGGGGDGGVNYYRQLSGAVVNGDTLGLLLRTQPPSLQLSESRLDFHQEMKTRTVYFRNPGFGLAIVDSVALANEKRFNNKPSYKGGFYGGNSFQKGQFLIFPNDSIRVDFFLLQGVGNEAFVDTFRVYTRGINNERLPEIKIPVAFSPRVAIDQKDSPASMPRQIALKIYPNPSNAQVTITFETSERGKATIRVVNMLGREVAVLLNETKAVGAYRINWDAHELNAGIYFIELETGGERRVQKWLLLK